MSDVAITATGNLGQGTAPPAQGYQLWSRVRWAGYILLGLQLVGYLVWSTILYQHFAVTGDFAFYSQAWYLIAHGNLDPYSTIFDLPFWQNNAEFVIYVLAPLYWIFHTGIVLQWVQDLCLAGAELVCFTWLCDLARRHCAERDAAWLAGLGLLLLIANPWLWETMSFDLHMEPLAVLFAALLARDLSRGKLRAWAWVVPLIICGAATTTYIVAFGLGGVLLGRATRRMGAAIATAGIAYSLVIHMVDKGGAAAAVITQIQAEASGHPFNLVTLLWDERANIIANVAPGGLVGIGAPLILPLALAVVVPDTLYSRIFGEPNFQNVPLYVILPVGTVVVLAWLLRRHRRTALVVAGVAAAQAIGWAAIWGPQIPIQWLRVSGAEAGTLASVQARIPASAEVIASQGVVGRFSGRTHLYSIHGPGGKLPLLPGTWFVITPTSGIESLSTTSSMALIGELAGPLHAQLITHANGVWAFRVTPPPGINSIYVPTGMAPHPAWAAAGVAGRPVLDGPESTWHMAAIGARGYVADGMQWQIYPGRYQVSVTLSASAPVNVELWDDTINRIVTRRAIAQTDGVQRVGLPLTVPTAPGASVFSGWGPFNANFMQPPAGQRIEVRVWSPGGVTVNVYSADLTTASGSAVPASSVSDAT